jgi:hypothetical protein
MAADRIIAECFRDAHDGYSVDVLIVDDELRGRFVENVAASDPSLEPEAALRALLNLRKRKRLGVPTVKRAPACRHDEYRYASEIAARQVEDQFGLTLDRALCRDDARSVFDAECQRMRDEPAKLLRLAALALRKSRQLKPQLTDSLTRAGREVSVLPASAAVEHPEAVPACPGVYVFRDRAEGYLYIGEAGVLRDRVSRHLDHSDRKALAHYFWNRGYDAVDVEMHAFPDWPLARQAAVRRSIEREMIESQRPKLNIQFA